MAQGFLNKEEIAELRSTDWASLRHEYSEEMGNDVADLVAEDDMDEEDEFLNEKKALPGKRTVPHSRVELGSFLRRLRDVKGVDRNGEEGEADRLEAQLGMIREDLEEGQAGGHANELPSVDVGDFIETRKGALDVRFDVQFCELQRKKAADSLALCIYVPFIIIFTYVLVQGKGLGIGYWMNANLEGFILGQEFDVDNELRFAKTYYDIKTNKEFWQFVEGPLQGGVWPEDGEDGSSYMQISNAVVGALKVRQIRVEAEDCPHRQGSLFENNVEALVGAYGMDYVRKRLREFRPYCAGELDMTSSNADQGPYTALQVVHDGLGIYSMNDTANQGGWQTSLKGYTKFPPMYVENVPVNRSTASSSDAEVSEAWRYHTCSELNGTTSFLGKKALYHCDGYGFVIPISWTKEQAGAAFETLKEGISIQYHDPFYHEIKTKKVPWMDERTRGVFFDLILYNQNVNLFTHMQIGIEITAGGHYIPTKSFTTFRLEDFSSLEIGDVVLMVLFILYVAGFWVHLVAATLDDAKAAQRGLAESCSCLRGVWKSLTFWRLYDITNMTLFVINIIFRFLALSIGTTGQSVLQTQFYPEDYETVAFYDKVGGWVMAFNALFTYFRVFYFLALQPGLNILTQTITFAARDLLGILFIFLVVFMAFSLMAYVVFGNAIEDYRTFPDTLSSSSRMLIGDFDYEELRLTHRMFTPVFFAIFNILAVFILLNMVIAILDEAFGKVMERKYNPRKLLALLARDETGYFDEPTRKKVRCEMLRKTPIGRECKWQWRKLVQSAQVCCGQFKENDATFRQRRERYRMENPRLYWQDRLDQIRTNNAALHFKDRMNIIPRELDDILMDRFGQDYQLMESDLIDTPARAMRRPKSELLQDIVAFHHVWSVDVSTTTLTGQEREEAEEQKQEEREASAKKRFQNKMRKDKQKAQEETINRLRAKYKREPTEEEQLLAMIAEPPWDRNDVEQWWIYLLQRMRHVRGLMTSLQRTRNRNFQSTAPKREFAAKMVNSVRDVTAREITDGMLITLEREMKSHFQMTRSSDAVVDPVSGLVTEGTPFTEAELLVGDRVLYTLGEEPQWGQVVSLKDGDFEITHSGGDTNRYTARQLLDMGARRRALRVGDKTMINVAPMENMGGKVEWSAETEPLWVTIVALPERKPMSFFGSSDDSKVKVRIEDQNGSRDVAMPRKDWDERARPEVQPLPESMDGVLQWWRDGRYEHLQRKGLLAAFQENVVRDQPPEDEQREATALARVESMMRPGLARQDSRWARRPSGTPGISGLSGARRPSQQPGGSRHGSLPGSPGSPGRHGTGSRVASSAPPASVGGHDSYVESAGTSHTGDD
eukprot:Hpha_TRINITY_DN26619_c0_g1::TRINITY_DN26619_c0_g1_i1::g.86073::m.86073